MKSGYYTLITSWQTYFLKVKKTRQAYILKIKSNNKTEIHAVYDNSFPKYLYITKLYIVSKDHHDDRYEFLVYIVQALIKVCIDSFPFLECIIMKDIVSDPLIKFLFTYYHLFMYGKTWYEINFGASTLKPACYILDDLRHTLWQSPNSNYSSFISFFNEQKRFHGTSFYFDNIKIINELLDTQKLYTAKWIIPKRNALKYEDVFMEKKTFCHQFQFDGLLDIFKK